MNNEAIIRLGFFFGVFALMSIWELLAPRRFLTTPKKVRWFSNLVIVLANSLLLRLVVPILPVGVALMAQERRWGLLNAFHPPYWLAVIAGVVILDCVIYLQHLIFHIVPPFWRIHRMHHADLDLDVTSGLRFHPIEIILSLGLKLATVALLGPPALAVLIFEVVLNATSMFNHSNVYIPLGIDKVLRLFVVTPDMHRVHHSIIMRESNNNYGFSLPWWDRLFGTYRSQPEAGHKGMTIGLALYRNARYLTLPWMLIMPFFSKPDK